MVLKPEKMVRIRIIGSNSRKADIISALHDVGIIQLENVDPEVSKLLSQPRSSDIYKKVNQYLQKFRGYESVLPAIKVKEKRNFSSLEDLLKEAESINLDDEIKTLKSSESDIMAEQKENNRRMEIVDSFININYDLSIFSGSYLISYLSSGKPSSIIKGILKEHLNEATVIVLSEEKCVITIPEKLDSDLAKIANDNGFNITHIPPMSGTPAQYREALLSKNKDIQDKLDKINEQLAKLSEKYYERIAQITEQLEIENSKLEVSEKLASTKDAFALEGWIPEKYYEGVAALLNDASEEKVILSKVNSNEDPPTLFDNPRRFKLFEFFIRFYSLPKEYEIDPTLIFAIIFPVFFGIMVGDWGYGVAILAIALWMKKRILRPSGKSLVPKFLRQFVLKMFGANALLVLSRALIPASMAAIAAGLLFNSFFGFPLLPVTVFSTLQPFTAHIGAFPPTPVVLVPSTVTLPKLLLISGYIGLAVVSFGLILGVFNEAAKKKKKEVFGKVGWLAFAWGISMFGLNLIHTSTFSLGFTSTASIIYTVTLALIIAGIALVLLTLGGEGAVELPSMISHILSYARIMGILLASVILSYIVDFIFLKGLVKSPLYAVVGILILLVGQTFILLIAILEPGIQGARLIYVEFFSKFYEGNGHYFRPFSSRRKYTVPKFSLQSGKR